MFFQLLWSFQHQFKECWLFCGTILHFLAAIKYVVCYKNMTNIILVIASWDTSLLPWLIRSTAYKKIDCCMVGRIITIPSQLYLPSLQWLNFASVRSLLMYACSFLIQRRQISVIACSLAIRHKSVVLVARSSRYNIKNIILVVASCTIRHANYCHRLIAIQGKKYAQLLLAIQYKIGSCDQQHENPIVA